MPCPGAKMSSEEIGTGRAWASTVTSLNRGTYSNTAVSWRCALKTLPQTPSSTTSVSTQEEKSCSVEIGTRTVTWPPPETTRMASVVSRHDVRSMETARTMPRTRTHWLSSWPSESSSKEKSRVCGT